MVIASRNNLGKRRVFLCLNQDIGVDKSRAESLGKQDADGAFAATRKPDQTDNVLAGHVAPLPLAVTLAPALNHRYYQRKLALFFGN